MGAWLFGLPSVPWRCCVRPHPDKGGQATGFRGCARLAAQCAGLPRRCSGCSRLVGLTSPRLGAFRCGGLRLLVAFIFRPRKGVPRPTGTVTGTAPCTVGPPVSSCLWPWCGEQAGAQVAGRAACNPAKLSWRSRAAGRPISLLAWCAGRVVGRLGTARHTSWWFGESRPLTGMHHGGIAEAPAYSGWGGVGVISMVLCNKTQLDPD